MRGVEVSRRFYETEVAPRLDGVAHAAGRVGRGSDVLGFDDVVSQDHDWGERVTVITDRGRPVAAIVPINAVPSEQPALSATARSENAAAGWMRRIEQVRDAVRRQHAMRITGLERALIDVWAVIDRLLPQGSDTTVDELRIVHRDVLAMPPPAIEPPAQPS